MGIKFLDIHFEAVDDGKGRLEELQKILENKIPCAISIAPYTIRQGWYDATTLDFLTKAFEQGAILGQQGNYHKCKNPHSLIDKWHENYCLYNGGFSYDEQIKVFQEGRETLMQFFKNPPKLYVPPNHLYDEKTLEIALEMGYKFFAERGLIQKQPYKFRNSEMIVLPEVKLGNKGIVYYVHYDKIKEKKQFYDEVARTACDFSWIEPQEVCEKAIYRNMKKVRRAKIERDIFKMPEKIAEMLRGK
jgi:hypothetical protein